MKLEKSCVLVLGLLLAAGLAGGADKPGPVVDEEKPVAGQPQPVGEAKQPAEVAQAKLPKVVNSIGMTLVEIADVLSIPVGTVKSRLHSIRQELKMAFEENENERH